MTSTFAYKRFDIDKYDSNEQIPCADGLYVHAEDAINREAVLQAEIRTLQAQLKDARAANPGEQAMQAAAATLPAAYDLRIYLERGAGWVELYDPDGKSIDFDEDTDSSMTGRIRNATEAAIEHAKEPA
jgi:hypothetical protein